MKNKRNVKKFSVTHQQQQDSFMELEQTRNKRRQRMQDKKERDRKRLEW